MNRPLFVFAAGALCFSVLPLEAAKAPLSKEKLEKQASHIVSGEVVSVTTKDQKSKIETGLGIHRDRIYTIRLKVRSVSKGEGIEAGDEVVVEAWKPLRRIPNEPGLQGHEGIPAKGDTVTVFATKNAKKGAYEPLLPNGIAAAKKTGEG